MSKTSFTNDSDADLDQKSAWYMYRISLLCWTTAEGELLLLKNKGIIVQRSWLRDSIQRVDDAGVLPRKKKKA